MPLRGRRQQRKRVITDSDSDDGDDTPAPSRKRVQKQRTSTDQDIEIEDDVSDDFSDEPDYTAFYAALFPSSKAQHLPLKSDHADRPLYVCPDRRVILEAWSPLYTQAQDFLIAISEPISRPKLMHEFKITEFSLCAAVSVGLDSTSILSVLSKLSKTPLPESVEEFITEKTESFGKLKLVLREGEFWVESRFERVVKRVLQDETVASCRVVNTVQSSATADLIGMEDLALVREQVRVEEPFQHAGQTNRTTGQDESGSLITDEQSQKEIANGGSHNMQEFGAELEGIDLFQLFEDDWDDSAAVPPMAPPIPVQEPDVSLSNSVSFVSTLDEQDQPALNYLSNNGSSPLFGSVITLDALEDADTDDTQHQNSPSSRTSQNYTYSFQIKKESVSLLRQRCSELNYPLLDEYDFRRDTRLPVLDADLKPSTKLRPYQEEGLSKMFSSGRGRSGVIVLPCGAGKTLVGVTAACTVKKSCLVLCTSNVSVDQWIREFKYWSTLKDTQIGKFTSDCKERFITDAGILVSTYSMLAYTGKRAYDASKLMTFIQSRDWGLLLLDEVHVVPADMFKKTITLVTSQCKLGLTATLVREDDKIRELNYLIGPKLYEANWLELAGQGHIARVQCAAVWCPMTREFYGEYLAETSRKRQLLYVMNPTKIQACQYLIEYHEAMGDKIIVFSDNVFALKHYANTFNKPFIYGGTSSSERSRILHQFRYNPGLNVIFLSKVGDTSIDLPEASCLIQVSSHFGSRRQEAQRLGRILRPKKRTVSAGGGPNAYFYTLVSRDTEEMYFSTKRQQFLVDQGYAFKVVTKLEGLDGTGVKSGSGLVYADKGRQIDLLNTVLLASEVDYGRKDVDSDVDLVSENDEEEVEHRETTTSAVIRSNTTLTSLSGGDSMAYLEFKKVYMRRRR